jgi:hypothetical protein
LPVGWQERAIARRIEVGGRVVTAVAPCPEDLIVSKLARLDDKDRVFVEAYHNARPIDRDLIAERLRQTRLDRMVADRALAYIRGLA